VRTISADNEAILSGTAPRTRSRLRVADSGATLRDLTTYAQGLNLLKEVRWGEGNDDNGISWNASVVREAELLSVAPLMATSGLNKQFDIATAYAPLLQVGRAMRVEWALDAEDSPAIPSWNLAFSGYVDAIDWGDNTAQLSGRGEEARVIDGYIERERVYAFAQGANADRGCYIFEPSQTYAVGDRLLPTSAQTNNHFYRVTAITTGIAAATEPVWPTGGGASVVSGGVTFTESGATSKTAGTNVETVIQQLLDDTLGIGTVSLWCPVSPAWAVKSFLVTRQSLFEELRLLAAQAGFCLRYMFDSGTGTMRLKLYSPNRTTTTSLRTFAISKVDAIKKAQIQIFDIRNVVRIVYSDSQDLDSSGYPKRKTYVATSATSIAKYSRRFCELAEASNSQIDTLAEATVLGDSILSDLEEPSAEFSAAVPFFPFAELPDLYTLAANGVHFDSDQKLALVRYDHTHGAAEATSTFDVRGKPAAGNQYWLQRCTDAYDGSHTHQITALENFLPIGLVIDSTPVGGARIKTSWTAPRGSKNTELEIHLSTSPGFTPSSSTLYATGKERSFEVGNLDPAKTWYAQAVPVTWNGTQPVRGGASAEVSFAPGRAVASQLNPNVVWGGLPLNGSFETQLDSSAAPDFWFCPGGTGGVWGTNAFLLNDASGLSGVNYVKLITTGTTNAAGIFSAEFTVNEKTPARASVWRKTKAGGANTVTYGIVWYDKDHGVLGASPSETFLLNDQVDVWVEQLSSAAFPPATARFARLFVIVDAGAANRECHIDAVEFIEDPPTHVRATTATAGSYATNATIQFGTEVYDLLGEYDPTTWTFTAKRAGYYRISAAIFADSQTYNLGNSVQLYAQKNGTIVAYGHRAFAPSTASWYLTSAVDTTVLLAVGDTLKCAISHDRAAGNVALFADANGNYLAIDRLP
jgi:hypothetical protein